MFRESIIDHTFLVVCTWKNETSPWDEEYVNKSTMLSF